MSSTNYDVYVRIIDLIELVKASSLIQNQIQKKDIDRRPLVLIHLVVFRLGSF
jgi:hypothetical protein